MPPALRALFPSALAARAPHPHTMNKKGAEAPPKILLGRPSNNLKMGIVGA